MLLSTSTEHYQPLVGSTNNLKFLQSTKKYQFVFSTPLHKINATFSKRKLHHGCSRTACNTVLCLMHL
jgi:hypothetical protein